MQENSQFVKVSIPCDQLDSSMGSSDVLLVAVVWQAKSLTQFYWFSQSRISVKKSLILQTGVRQLFYQDSHGTLGPIALQKEVSK